VSTGGLLEFRELYPEWVESNESRKQSGAHLSSSSSSSNNSPGPFGEAPLLGLGSLASLRIQDEGDACDSSLGLELDDVSSFPFRPFIHVLISVLHCKISSGFWSSLGTIVDRQQRNNMIMSYETGVVSILKSQ